MAELTTLTAVTMITSEGEKATDAVNQRRQNKQPTGRRRKNKTVEEDALAEAAQFEG
jgi:hypothetical protein